MNRATSFTIQDVAKAIGTSATFVREQIAAGRLKAGVMPTLGQGERRRRRIAREDLAAFMVRHGLELTHVRRALNPSGYLLALRVESDVAMHLSTTGSLPLVRLVPSLFHLGRCLGEHMVWGVLVDLANNDPVEVHRAFREYSTERDRPELIGLYPDDGLPASFIKSNPFDVLIPRATGPAGIARAVACLRPR